MDFSKDMVFQSGKWPSFRTASRREKLGLIGEDKSVKSEKIQDGGSDVKSKMNRLKRTKKSDILLSECKIIRHEITRHHQKCSHTSMRSSTIHGAQCSPPRRGLLHMMVSQSQGQSAPEFKSESPGSGQWELLGRSESLAGQSGEELKSGNSTAFNSYSTPAPTSPSLRTRFESSTTYFKDLLPREQVLRQVNTKNLRFPVGRLFQTLLKPHGEIKTVGKRRQEVQSHCDAHQCKRQRTGQDDSETVKASVGCVRSRHGERGRNRLRRKRPCVRDAAVDAAYREEGCMRHDDDVLLEEDTGYHDDDIPWTERFRPRCCEEVVGNSAAVRKLYSWLKEWRMRADVEERRKSQEECRMKEELNGPWDCGDFKGDLLMDQCDGKQCNTLLIYGPTGTGKSAAVFACAEQLGFKVLEVNSSSLRSGRVVLSQLRESTQSHQVGAPQCSVSLSHTPVAASRDAPQKSSAIPRTSSRKKCDIGQRSISLAPYFRKTRKFGNKHLELQDAAGGDDDVTLDEAHFKKDGALEKKNETAGISLILFEEVDIVFAEDVGFLAAVKSLISTTKRPIILTASDRRFGETFGGHLEEIHFKTPAKESVVSHLQYMSDRVQNVKAEPGHIHFLLQENNGDMRRSVLDLEFWARSGGGDTHYHFHNRTLTCKSFTELESSRCVEVLEENWKKGRSLLYSNLDFLLDKPTTERKRSRIQVLKTKSSPPFRHMNQSSAEAGEIPKINSLAQFLDTMSFVDSYLCWQPSWKSGPLGAKMADGLLDEPREVVGGKRAEMTMRGLERCYEILAVVEGLGFHRCRMEVSPMTRDNQDVTEADKNNRRILSEEKCGEVVCRVLCSKAFRYHGHQTAVLTDYLPCLRFICRQQGAGTQSNLRFSHYLRDIGLHLPKSVLDLLASQLQ